jgi:hypothetical protein
MAFFRVDRLLEYDLRITTQPGQSIKLTFGLNPAGIEELVEGL